MAFHLHRPAAGAAIGEINMIPLIDVMLVLLVIVLLAAPLLTQAVTTDLPRADAQPDQPNPEAASLEIAADGAMTLDGAAVAPERLEEMLRHRAGPRAELRLNAHPATPYDTVARAMAAAGRAGIAGLSFITMPEGAK